MNFQNLEYFRAVAEEKNITRAAEKFHMSQQAMSGQIARLELDLGCALFDRKNSFELTAAGKYFFDSASRILDISKETQSVIRDFTNNLRGELSVGISFSRGQAILPEILPDFMEKYPLVRISIVEDTTRELEALLAKGKIDLLIGYAPFMLEYAETRILIKERMFLIVPRTLLQKKFGEKYESVCAELKKKPDIAAFSEFPFVLLKKGDRLRTLAEHEFSKNHMDPEIVLETENIQTSFSLAAAGTGVCLCPELYLNSAYTIAGDPQSMVRRQVELFPLADRNFGDTIAIGYNTERYQSRIARDFLRMATEKFAASKNA